ncbi:MAG: hypothetical protein KDK44_04130, partial [Chlamydiia bacterium]|nr:hypothetical protein [Chlamydiia bacterium]
FQCGEIVRLRGGRQRHPHFFHPNPQPNCTNHRKSHAHLQVQLRLLKIFSDGKMEHYFPEINRFADVVTPSHKLIFEVQCSPISLFEVRARQKAYAQTGFLLVWILHEKSFNKRYLSDAEKNLRQFPSYYTNIDARGHGWIYDQLELLNDVKRFYIGKKCPVHLAQHYYFKDNMFSNIPAFLNNRTQNWPVFFKGDLLHRVWLNPEFAEILIGLEKKGNRLKMLRQWKKMLQKLGAYHNQLLKKLLLRNAKR